MTVAARWPALKESANNQFFSSNRNGSDLVLRQVVVYRPLPITQEARECAPALEAVVHGFGRGRPICDLPALQFRTLMYCVDQGPRAGLAVKAEPL